ncbi:MurR/RpiR family transcriptional regulator [Cupriavidus taiwanensis]|uniref:GlvR family transcriptional regulator n=1 Tax=Cupriavidus taiwanensis TaxID=164546 RepID=A0A375GVC4_9BURK|nr:MurR/RpiR family transcriptional regulator [Cupriavidus taiwanensis]SOY54312.1 putative transcriptional regulator, RpiR and Sugar isomerase (SIS) domains [Cupriavidus taiwanensis]SOY55168.1 putative transcriptional regulator, RpiR and Sugar isomerase (SIS) domains [Cupriavidus taiwanensis]SOY89173.1 putative transcriptional regulator, RpiR and Sugar isomerase (SIS) domains [Cupriavidus taiwanensis]SOZ24813.1 putative transcriptional regulator, RpiR and Sugar isomerase (SIS) domains [Cupriavi
MPSDSLASSRPGPPTPTPAAPPHDLEALLELLRRGFPSLSTQFQGGARYLLDHPQDVPVLSMRKIAASAGVQPATLVRLSQHLGFEGWQAMRELFVEALRGGTQPYARRARKVVRESSASRMLGEMLEAQHHNLDRIAASNEKTLPQAAELLSHAACVHVAGFRSCFPIAFTFHYVYRLFRSTVHLIRADAGTLEMELRGLAPKDAVVVVSFAPYSQESIRVAEAARECGCKVIALTDSTVAPIALAADCTLLFSVESPSFFPSITAGVAVVEALVEQLLARKGKGAIRALEQAEGELHRTGAYVTSGHG